MINNDIGQEGVNSAMKQPYALFLGFWLTATGLAAQSGPANHLLDEIGFYADVMVNANSDDHRSRAHDGLTLTMDSLLALPESYSITLDSIRWLSVLHGDDFRIVTWQWKVNEDEYKYGGFLQWPDKIVALKDSRPFINGAAYTSITPATWYGCLYYQIIPFERERKKYYMLLGFNGENSRLNTKIADVLDLNGDQPKLGVPVFVGKEDPMSRIIVSYADVSTVHIRYDKELGGIIYDHVDNLTGVGINGESMPMADGSLEGWIEKNGDWIYQEEVYDVQVDTPPMTEERKDKKEDKDILGRPKKQ